MIRISVAYLSDILMFGLTKIKYFKKERHIYFVFLFFYSSCMYAQDLKNLVINPTGDGNVFCCEFNKACISPTAWYSYNSSYKISKEKKLLIYTEGKSINGINESYLYTIIALSQKLETGCTYSIRLHLPKNKVTFVYFAFTDSIHTIFFRY